MTDSGMFKCKHCGLCCKNQRGRWEESKPKLPFLYQYTPLRKTSFSVLDWELPLLERKANELSFQLKVLPRLVLWDEIHKISLVLSWTFDYDNCPFLSRNNLCQINNDKPLTCKLYPLFSLSLFDREHRRKEIMIEYSDCPNVFEIKEKTPQTQSRWFTTLFRAYGNCFVAMLRDEYVDRVQNDLIKDLIGKGKIFPSRINKETIRCIKADKPIGFYDFLRSSYPDLHKEAQNKIQQLYTADYDFLRS